MKDVNSKCLVLNADFTPLVIIGWRRAVVWSVKYEHNPNIGVQIIDFYKDDFINGSNNRKIPIPAVVKMASYRKLNSFAVNFSRKNLFIRDNMTCQYCGMPQEINNLTYDHVIPKSQWNFDNGSPTTWTNVVTACVTCNRKKRNRTPTQANMPLLSMPIKPSKTTKYLPMRSYLARIRHNIPQEWLIYLPPSYLEL